MMKVNQKKKLQACILSLKEINEKIRGFSNKQRQELLPLCQQMAVEMGNTIEENEAENSEVISLLEKYCEEIYTMYAAEEDKAIENSCVQIKGLLELIENCAEEIEELPIEILFLPYKASMWDAMESVYQAAINQSDCHVTVMPIPYYNVNPQGEILSVEYEGNLFPKDIELMDINNYKLEVMKPDAIFIHNPYDQYNYVTRVAPNFFSAELIKHTERLIYIPYFVASWNNVREHFCITPGVKNAWRTFVQSDSIRKKYLLYTRRQDSIVALGSPKFDKVKAVEENLSRVPVEWKKVFMDKKVFILNTHLNSLINQAEEMVDKLVEIFRFFQRKKGIALLWRPHPLSMETAKSLNPGFTQRYLDLIERFKGMSIGIYDESADIHRAIAVSDGYIGDTSSIVPLYGITGKPIFIYSGIVNNIWEKGKIRSKEEQIEKERVIERSMEEAIEALQFLYFEEFISLEYYIGLVVDGRDICAKKRKERFMNLQYDYHLEETAGERIWKYVYSHIMDVELV